MQNVSHNLRHGNLQGQIFEIGKGHYRKDQSYLEDQRLGFSIWGQTQALWADKVPDVYRLKSFIDNLLEVFLSGSKWQWKPLQTETALFHPGQVIQLIYQGQPVGILGSVHPQKAKEWKWREDVAFAELDFSALFKISKPHRFRPLSSFPAVEKDLAFIVPKTMPAQDIQREIIKAGGTLLTHVHIVDLYEGAPLQEEQRSLSFRMVFQSPERTLADEEVLKLFQQIIDSVSHKLKIQLR